MIDTGFIFAAGFGTRMGELTKTTPKPLIRVGGETLLNRAIGTLRTAAVDKLHINTHYLAGQIHDAVAHDKNITIHPEPDGPYETGGGMKAALPALGADPVMTINPDAIFLGRNPADYLKAAWRHDVSIDALLLVLPVENALGYQRDGDFFLDGDRPRWRGEAPHAPYIYTGMHILRPARLNEIGERDFSLTKLWQKTIAEGRTRAIIYPDKWIDVGNKDALGLAEDALAGVRDYGA